MNRFIVLLIMYWGAFLAPQYILAQQKNDHVWISGYDRDLNGPELGGLEFNFSQNPVEIMSIDKQMDIDFTSSTMSNANGELMFYTNGCYIANFNHELIENGGALNPGWVHDNYCQLGYPALFGALSIPKPNTDSIYYLFHTPVEVITTPVGDAFQALLYVTTINMSENGGRGKVVEKNKVILNDTLAFGSLQATKHRNGDDWWIMCAERYSNNYYTLLVTRDSILGPYSQMIGDTLLEYGKQGSFSPSGNKFAIYGGDVKGQLFDFDNSSGMLTNYRKFEIEEGTLMYGLAFSPSERYLFVAIDSAVYQVNLEDDDIETNIKKVATSEGTYFGNMYLAPDCKIYIRAQGTHFEFHRINNPDSDYSNVEVEQAIPLPSINSRSLPHIPHFRTYKDNSPCDGTYTSNQTFWDADSVEVSVRPNPANDYVHVNCKNGNNSFTGGILYLLNPLGQVMYDEDWDQCNNKIDVSGLSNGIYLIQIKVSSQPRITIPFVVLN